MLAAVDRIQKGKKRRTIRDTLSISAELFFQTLFGGVNFLIQKRGLCKRTYDYLFCFLLWKKSLKAGVCSFRKPAEQFDSSASNEPELFVELLLGKNQNKAYYKMLSFQ
ncbi:hypothetical protein [Endozoicomonas lisbonensis]|uniref:hypothetical protein n=1 Tax=Endozoicomonas lisbonensis TaxID=3120522 RepID=UPI0033917CB1